MCVRGSEGPCRVTACSAAGTASVLLASHASDGVGLHTFVVHKALLGACFVQAVGAGKNACLIAT